MPSASTYLFTSLDIQPTRDRKQAWSKFQTALIHSPPLPLQLLMWCSHDMFVTTHNRLIKRNGSLYSTNYQNHMHCKLPCTTNRKSRRMTPARLKANTYMTWRNLKKKSYFDKTRQRLELKLRATNKSPERTKLTTESGIFLTASQD
jgi:hypothetical protein